MTKYPKVGDHSPWGCIDHIEPVDSEITFVGTPSHGGYWVHEDLWRRMPKRLQETKYSRGGWFEEDCDWVLPVLCFPERFSATTIEHALKIAQEWHKPACAHYQKRGGACAAK